MEERTEKARGALMKHHQRLRIDLLIENFLPAFRPLLTEVEYSRVDGKGDNVAQVDELIRILLTKEYQHFEGFCTALANNGYKHWADKLRKEVEGPHRPSTVEGLPQTMPAQICTGRSVSAPVGGHKKVSSPLACSPGKHMEWTMSCSNMKKGPTTGTHGSTVMNLPPMPCKLQVISSGLFKDKVYVTGVATEGDVVSHRVQVYSLEEVKWFALPEAPSYNASAAIINGCFTLIGGRLTKDTTITNILCSWIEEESRWVERVSPMPTARLESGVCHHDNLLLVTGGIVDSEQEMLVNTVDIYNFSTERWSTPKALELPKALRSHHLVVFKGNIYLAAGATTYPAPPETGSSEAWRAQWSDVIKAVEQPSKAAKIWTPITAPPAPRATVVAYRNHLFSVGGVDKSIPQTAICTFVDGKTDNYWEQVGTLNVGRFRHGVVPLDSHATVSLLFVASGYVQGKKMEDEGNEKSNSVELVIL